MHTPGGWGCLDLRCLLCYWAVFPLLEVLMVVCSWPAGCLCKELAWGWGRLQWAKMSMLCWNLDSSHGPNSVSEWCCGCLDWSLDLAQCHAKDPGMYLHCFLTNKSSKYLEHCWVQCQEHSTSLESCWMQPCAGHAGASQVAVYHAPRSRILSREQNIGFLWEEFQFSDFLLSM